ncbi:MAG: deoxyribodipyrimidine photolyase-related protein [Verrucomicrobiales bacterium]|jgi:deoxyribodipyrimidine photolyase-related protein
MPDVTLIFPHQLFDPHPALSKDRPVYFVEDSLIFGNDPYIRLKFHQQKVVLHRASMKTFAAELQRRGYQVHYIDFKKGKTTSDHFKAKKFGTLHYCETTDFLLEKRLHQTGKKIEKYATPMFLSPRDWLAEQFPEGKKPFMARFYERQRKRMGILLNKDGSPVGGQWSLDEDNRKPMPKRGGLDVPPDPGSRATDFTKEAIAYVEKNFPDHYGRAADFNYPVSHASAETWFENFLEQRFQLFGDYEDAIAANQRVLFHSIITPMLNIGLLTPQKVIDRTLEFAAKNNTPLNCVEGFVRQIIGWREFMRGIYEHIGVESRNGNFWGFEDKPIPEAFYTASTGIEPIDNVIQRTLDHAYCHHIERLMLLGNFMLLCNFHPRRVYDWFMELFIDAYDWVMVPNVHGMSQFGDGGMFTTKPYISGSNYVRKMSDYKKGGWCDTWDGLFWMFIKDHEEFFRSQHRLGMMARQLDKMSAEKLDTHRSNAESFLESLA